MLLHKIAAGPLSTNTILIACPKTKSGAVIDPALGSTPALLEKGREWNVRIEKILLTHSHWDHFADAHALQAATKAPLYVHPLDAGNVEHPGADGLITSIPIQPVPVGHFLSEEESIWVGEIALRVIHCPGHSPGGVSFYIEAEKLLISGDTLFKGTMGSLHLPTAQPDQMWDTLAKLAALSPDTRVIPGHGSETTIGRETWLPNWM